MVKIPPLTLPYISSDFPGVGGQIKELPEDFQVEEIPLYQPCGEGEHFYVCLQSKGFNTRDLQKNLADLFSLPSEAVGYAGLKDKWALTTQVFSLAISQPDEEISKNIADHLPVEILWANRHTNKLKVGHLLGNRFQILLSHVEDGALERVLAVEAFLQTTGLPNFYGPQRFGYHGENLERALSVWRGKGRFPGWKRRFYLSALQAYLFNVWLTRRIQRGWWNRVLEGDMAKKLDTGGLFSVEDTLVEQVRFTNREITFTGPIYGRKMRWPQGEPGLLEKEVLDDLECPLEKFGKLKLKGSRRAGWIYPSDLAIQDHPRGILFSFSLPKGSYATMLLREFQKPTEG